MKIAVTYPNGHVAILTLTSGQTSDLRAVASLDGSLALEGTCSFILPEVEPDAPAR